MAGITRAHPVVAKVIGEQASWGRAVTQMAIDFNVDADGSSLAMQAAHNAFSRYGNVVMAGAVNGSGQLIDIMIEGDLTGSDYVSADGTVTGTVAAALAEDLLNLGTVDGVNFATGTPAVTLKSTYKLA